MKAMAREHAKAIRPVGMGVGTSSLLVIFVILGMTVLALLSLSVSRADQSIGERVQSSMTDHYKAQAEISETLGLADAILAELRTQGGNFFQNIQGPLLALGCEAKENNQY
jgi:hypothetical protein